MKKNLVIVGRNVAIWLIAMLLCVSVKAATVTFTLTNYFSSPYTNTGVRVFPVSTPILANGSYTIIGMPIPLRFNTNTGVASTNLLQGNYLVTNSSPTLGILFAVPTSTNTYNYESLYISGASNGVNVYNYTPGVSSIIGTNGIVTTPSNGKGDVIIDGASFAPTFTQVTNSLGFLPLTATQVTNVSSNITASATNIVWTNLGTAAFSNATAFYHFSNVSNFVSASVTNGLATTNYANALTNALATTNFVNTQTNTLYALLGTAAFSNANRFYPMTDNLSNYVKATITNGLADTNFVNAQTNTLWNALGTAAFVSSNQFYKTSNPSNFVTSSITNGLVTLTTMTNATNSVYILLGTAAFSNSTAFYPAANPSNFVSATVTNGLSSYAAMTNATNTIVSSLGTAAYSNANLFYLKSNPSNFVDATITNGRANFSQLTNATNVIVGSLGTAAYSNSTQFYSSSNPSNYVAASITNGLATTNFVNTQTNTLWNALGSAAFSNSTAFYQRSNPSNYVTATQPSLSSPTITGSNIHNASIAFPATNISTLFVGNNQLAISTNATFVRISGVGGAFTIASITGGWNGRYLIVENSSGYTLTVAHDSSFDPTAANRIDTGKGQDITVTNNPGIVTFVYDSTSARWIVALAGSGATSGEANINGDSANTGYSIVGSKVGVTNQLKTFLAGSGLTISTNTTNITLSAGALNYVSNYQGTATNLLLIKNKSGTTNLYLHFKTTSPHPYGYILFENLDTGFNDWAMRCEDGNGMDYYKGSSVLDGSFNANEKVFEMNNDRTWSRGYFVAGNYLIASNLVADRALVSATDLSITNSAVVSTTELNYLDGVTSALQTQLDSKLTGNSTSYITNYGTVTAPITLNLVADGEFRATNVLYVTNSRVGIGTNNPGAALHVVGGTAIISAIAGSANANIVASSSAGLSLIAALQGSIFCHNGTAATTLTVGTDNRVLVADSTAATGLTWTNNLVSLNITSPNLLGVTTIGGLSATNVFLTTGGGSNVVGAAVASSVLAASITDETGSGSLVLSNAPTINNLTVNNATASTVATYNGSKLLGSIANGTANRVLGMNSGATGQEYKSLTSGGGVTITHSAGAVSFKRSNLFTNYTTAGNVGTGEDQLVTSPQINSFSTAGQSITFFAAGTLGASVNNKRIKVLIRDLTSTTNTIFDTGAMGITAATDWSIRGTFIKTGSGGTAAKAIVEYSSSSSVLASSVKYTATTVNFVDESPTIFLTGEGTDNNDVVFEFWGGSLISEP